MWRFYSKCVNIIEFAKDACLNPGWRTDIQGQEEKGERGRMEEERKSLPTLACLNYEFHLFMHFVLAHCHDDFFGIMAHTDPVLWPLLGGRLSCCLSSGHDERFQKQRGDGPGCGLPSLMSPIPSLNPFSSDYLILCFIEALVAQVFTVLMTESHLQSPSQSTPSHPQVQLGILESYLSYRGENTPEGLVFPLSHSPFYLSLLQRA